MHAANCDGPDDLGTPSCPGTTTTSHGATTTTHATVLPATLSSIPSATAPPATISTAVVHAATVTSVPVRTQTPVLPNTGTDPFVALVGGLALVVGALCARLPRHPVRRSR